MGKIVAYQYEPCKKNNVCEEDPLARLTSEVPLKKCTSKKQKEIEEYWIERWTEYEGTLMASNAFCLDLEDIFITGEPDTNSEASLIIAF